MEITKISRASIFYLISRIKGKKYLLLALASGLICFALLILQILFLIKKNQDQYNSLLDIYGNSLSELTAAQLAVPMNANNLIGLQALISGLEQKQRVINVIIYDVNSNILVQTGSSQEPLDRHTEFTKAISLDQNLLGSLAVVIDTYRDGTYIFYLLLIISFVMALLITLALSYKHFIGRIPMSHGFIAETSSTDSETNDSADTQKTSAHQTVVIIQIQNMGKLFQQLNAQGRLHEMKQLNTIVNQAIKLYSGCIFAVSDQMICLRFEAPQIGASLFQGICCAHLLQKAHQKNSSLLRLTALVLSLSDRQELKNELLALQPVMNKPNRHGMILVEKELLDQSGIAERLLLSKKAEYKAAGVAHIEALQKNYQKLLDNQLELLT